MARSKPLQVKLPTEGYEALEALAKRERRPISDVVRQAIEEYAAKQGVTANFDVDRGGYRKRKSAGEEAS